MRGLILFCLFSVAHAHDSGEAKGTLQIDAAGSISLTLKMARADAAELLGVPDDAKDAAIDAALNAGLAQALPKWLVAEGCTWVEPAWVAAGVRGVTVTARGACDAPPPALSWPAATLTPLKLDLVAGVTDANGEARLLRFDRHTTRHPLAADPPSALGFFTLGVEHMLTGWDHLAFLLALVLACSRLRRLLIIVTSFTVAHSLTLALGATGVIALSGDIVEPIIAASIAVAAGVALYRLVAGTLSWPGRTGAEGSLALEVALCFGFGLVHGLGFAGLLEELAPDLEGVAIPLLTFNLGVEVGQVAAVAVTFPLLAAVGRSRAARPVFGALLAALVALGVVVATQRVLG